MALGGAGGSASGLPELGGGPGTTEGRRVASRWVAAAAAWAAAFAGAEPDQFPGGGFFGLGIAFCLGTGTVRLPTYSTDGD